MDAGLTLEDLKGKKWPFGRRRQSKNSRKHALQEGTKSNPIFVEEVKYLQRGQGCGIFCGGKIHHTVPGQATALTHSLDIKACRSSYTISRLVMCCCLSTQSTQISTIMCPTCFCATRVRYMPQTQQCIRCGWLCGYRCPATDASCQKCNRVGHFGAKCPLPRAQAWSLSNWIQEQKSQQSS